MPEKYFSTIEVDGEYQTNILAWSQKRLFTIISGLSKYQTFLSNLHTALWYRQKNPSVKSLFKGKGYRRPIYYVDYDLKSKQSPYSNGRWVYPKDLWTKDEFIELYGSPTSASRKMYYDTNYNYVRNVSKKWAEACDYQRILQQFEIPDVFTIESVENEIFEVSNKIQTLIKYKLNMKKTELYAQFKKYNDIEFLTKRINSIRKQGLNDYNDEMKRVQRDEQDLIKFEALKMLQGKTKTVNLEEHYSLIPCDGTKTVWYEGLTQHGITDFTSIGAIEQAELEVKKVEDK